MHTGPVPHRKSSRYVPLRTTSRASVYLSTEEIFLLAAMCAFAAFNLHDAENTNFFNILTIVPGAVFSFKCLVMNGDRSLIVMSIVTAYWLFFSIAIFNGYMYKNEDSYLSIRLMLLGALGAKAYRKNWSTKEEENEATDPVSPTPRTEQLSTSRMKSSTQLTSTSVQDSGSSRTQSSSWTLSTSSTMRTTTTMLEKAGLLRTGVPARSEKVETCGRLHTAAMKTLTVDRTQKTTDIHRTAREPEQRNNKVVVSYGDIITNPLATMRFSQKENTRKLTVTNITSRTIMWALKASTVHSFNAIPAHGILHPGMQQRIVICMVEQILLEESKFPSKIAIDYAFVNDNEQSFDRNVFKTTARKRHVLQAILTA
ncbi:hypothetical protein Y032_0169g219 [Ancylostoma ceylanicum]|nr:hypothetical protein Y032_0169g219 [Ancylostoma ceylanicum]